MCSQLERDTHILTSILEDLKLKKILSESLLCKGRLSYKALSLRGFTRNRNSVVSTPSLYSIYGDIKRHVERLPERIDLSVAREKYSDLIARINALPQPIKSTSELSVLDYKIYKDLLLCPHWPIVKRTVLSNVRPEYFYWTDNDLIEEAGNYKNLTQLKNSAGQLHRELKGRDLLDELMRRHSSYITHCYKGLGERFYTSQGELVFGNLIILAGLEKECEWQANTGLYRNNSNKPMTADFKLNEENIFVEISMFVKNGRGSRGKNYDERREEKQKIYSVNSMKYLFIDSSKFYNNGCIDSEAFSKHCISRLNELGFKGIDKKLSHDKDLFYFDSIDVKPDLSAIEYFEYLKLEFGLTHSAQLSNDKSRLLPFIYLREDSEEVIDLIRKSGAAMRIKKNKKHHQIKRKNRVGFAEVRDYARALELKNQREWYAHAKKNKSDFEAKHFCSAVPDVYKTEGWNGWKDFLGND